MADSFQATLKDSDRPELKIIELNGQLDEVGIQILAQVVDPLLNDALIHKIIFDFTQVTFINSKGIGYLVSVHTHLSKDDRVLAIANASQPVMDVISLVGLTSIIPYFQNTEEALKSI